MNAFIHFRKVWVPAHRDSELAKGPKSLSKLAGEAWHNLPKEERDRYHDMAKAAKKEHEVNYPDYKYEPKRKSTKSATSTSGSQRSSSAERDPDWVPSVLRRDASLSSRSSSSWVSTDESDAESLNTPYYSRGSSVDLSYTPDEDVGQVPPPTFPFIAPVPGMIVPPKDDRTPTQADFVYPLHNTNLLPAQQMVPNFPNGNFGAASNAQELAFSQYPSSSPLLSESSQPDYSYYHALPLQQVAHALPNDPRLIPHSVPSSSSQGSETLAYYDPAQTSSDTTSNLVQWEQFNLNDPIYASALDNAASTSQFVNAPAAPFSDYLNLTNDGLNLGPPLTPLTRLFFEQGMRNGSTPAETLEDLQDSFMPSVESTSPSSSTGTPSPPPPSYWPETIQDAYEVSGWSVPSQ